MQFNLETLLVIIVNKDIMKYIDTFQTFSQIFQTFLDNEKVGMVFLLRISYKNNFNINLRLSHKVSLIIKLIDITG